MHPDQVGPYRIEQKIGAGGMGTVYLGRHADTGEPAAVKVLPASLAREEGFVARFTREIDAMRRLANPHVVQLLESGVDNETYFYAMEYVEGETLTARLLRDKRIPWQETVEMAQQICVALKAAHDAGIIHRDLKPSNLLLAKDGQVKLTDFGVAQVFAGHKLTVTGGIIGTAEYMSPEQAQGTRVTKKSDLYSLGAVMYAMLTGRPPFSGKTTLEVIQKHKHAQFDRPSRFVDLPHWLDELVCQLLEKDPEKRPPDAYVVSRRLQEILRKVELSSSSDTLAATQAAGTGPGPTVVVSGTPAGPSPTLMRDLVRSEVERANAPGPIGRLFESTWVLVGLLAVVIVGGVLWFRSRSPSPEQRFAAGVELMEQPEGDGWLRARDEHFGPLLAEDPEWSEKVEPYLEQIEFFELKSGTASKRPSRRRTASRSEPDRILGLARHDLEIGDTAAAERRLSALAALLGDDPSQAERQKLIESLRERIRTERLADPDRLAFVQASLDRAEKLAAAGKRDEARSIWSSIVELYAGDPLATLSVQKAREALRTSETP